MFSFLRKIIVHVTRESSFWFLAFGGFLIVVSAVGRQVPHNVFDISFAFFFALLCTVCNTNLGRIDSKL